MRFNRERYSLDHLAGPPLLYLTNRTLAVTQGLRYAFGRAGGPFHRARPIPHARNPRSVTLAGNTSGDAAIAWFDDVGVHVSVRSLGHAFGAPHDVGRVRIRAVSVAVSVRGDVLVAWEDRGRIRTRAMRNSKTGFRPVQTIRSGPAYGATLRTAILERGTDVVAWGAQRLSEGGDRGPVTSAIARREAGAARFHPAEVLERQPATQIKGGLEFDPWSRTVAWTGWDGVHYRVRSAIADAHGRYRDHQDVSPAGEDGIVAALAASDDGRRLVVWNTVAADAGGGTLSAALAPPPRGRFGPPERLADGPEARVPAVAYDPAGRRFVAVWSDRPDRVSTVLRASLRSAG